jgi:hypothetical protein
MNEPTICMKCVHCDAEDRTVVNDDAHCRAAPNQKTFDYVHGRERPEGFMAPRGLRIAFGAPEFCFCFHVNGGECKNFVALEAELTPAETEK